MRRSFISLGFSTVALCAALVTSSITDSLEIANVALLLSVIIAVASMVDWLSGLVTAVVGAVSLNYFHTEPVHSLRITSTSDVLSVALLVILGVSVSLATALRVSERVRRYHASLSSELANTIEREQPASSLWRSVIDGVSSDLSDLDVRLVPTGQASLPVVGRRSLRPDESSSNHRIVRIPASGGVVEFGDPRLESCLVLTPRRGQTSVEVERSVVFQFADTVELALAHLREAPDRMVG